MTIDANTANNHQGGHWLQQRPKTKYTLLICLLILTVGTITCMFLPFISIDKAFKSVKYYSIIQTIGLMWDKELYALALIIMGFSVVFPFLKLATMFVVVYQEEPNRKQQHRLHWASRLGKWSMIDVFIVSLLLGIGNNQLLLKVEMYFALYLFSACIISSIALGIYISHLLHNQESQEDDSNILTSINHYEELQKKNGTNPDLQTGHNWLSISILSISSISFLGLCLIPFLEIDDWRLRDYSFTLISFIYAIWQQEAYALACYFMLTIIILPILEIAALWMLISNKNKILFARRQLNGAFSLMRHWSVLDVFMASLIIFVIEGEQFVKFKIDAGFWLLGITLIAYLSRVLIRLQFFKQTKRLMKYIMDSATGPIADD